MIPKRHIPKISLMKTVNLSTLMNTMVNGIMLPEKQDVRQEKQNVRQGKTSAKS
jgi:hypothetical protein